MPKQKLIVAVTGGRKYADFFNVQRALAKVSTKFDITVVHGNATGADTLADVWCDRTHTPKLVCEADWTRYGDTAGFLRNQLMIDLHKPQLLLAFPGGNGTRDMCDRCLLAGIPVKIIEARQDDRP